MTDIQTDRQIIGLTSYLEVVCGVVGTRIPHYSVLGDAVEIASLMESSGIPMMIQITENVKEILEKDGSFSMTLRGKVNIPMIGDIKSYWLNGKNENIEDED